MVDISLEFLCCISMGCTRKHQPTDLIDFVEKNNNKKEKMRQNTFVCTVQ